MTIHSVTIEQFLSDIDGHLALIKPGDHIEIDKDYVLIHPRDFRFLVKCAELVDDLPVGIESLIDDDGG